MMSYDFPDNNLPFGNDKISGRFLLSGLFSNRRKQRTSAFVAFPVKQEILILQGKSLKRI